MVQKNGWAQRKSIVLKHVRYNMAELIEEAKNPQIGTSLAVFKPQRIIDFVWEESTREWNKQKLDAVYANQAQHSLFDVEETKKKLGKLIKRVDWFKLGTKAISTLAPVVAAWQQEIHCLCC